MFFASTVVNSISPSIWSRVNLFEKKILSLIR